MTQFPLSVYVACSLTYAPEPFKAAIEAFKRKLGSICTVLCFNACDQGNHHAIYLHDIHHCVRTANLVLAFCDHPATALGYEIGTRLEAFRKPALLVAQKEALVTHMLLDMRHESALCELRRYDHMDEVLEMTRERLTRIWYEMNHPSQLRLFTEEVEGLAIAG